MTDADLVDRAIEAAGGVTALAALLGIASPSAITNWRRAGCVPAVQHIRRMAELAGVELHAVRPDIWAPPEAACPESNVPRLLRRMDTKLDRLQDDVSDLKVRTTSIEEGLAGVHRRLDRLKPGSIASNAASISPRCRRRIDARLGHDRLTPPPS